MIAENIQKIRERVVLACRKAGRDPADVRIVAVSKTFPPHRIEEAVRGGIVDIGENYIQELLEKRKAVGSLPVHWHFVGHLQTNKVKYIAEWIHLIHSVERVGLAREIDKRAAQSGRVIEVLVEVNTTGEDTKFGVRPVDTVAFVRQLEEFRHVRVAGLMTLGPFLPDPEGSRPMFKTLRKLKDELVGLRQENTVPQHLSMGMSGDFEVAIEEGATIIRIGTAFFGRRHKPQEVL
ncbi:MAG: YggS family pyridoxal phosphate-dependent enzyme [Ignavibacteria bacterium]|nr:YggS family pyridoxal phosphate-dependent enzyme [Ignavibacteria bacterium]